MVTGSGNIAAK